MADVTISLDDAREIISLFKAVKSADAIYKSCQSAQFRTYTTMTAKADNVQNAFRRLISATEAAETADATNYPSE